MPEGMPRYRSVEEGQTPVSIRERRGTSALNLSKFNYRLSNNLTCRGAELLPSMKIHTSRVREKPDQKGHHLLMSVGHGIELSSFK